jgi:hypothetical protein
MRGFLLHGSVSSFPRQVQVKDTVVEKMISGREEKNIFFGRRWHEISGWGMRQHFFFGSECDLSVSEEFDNFRIYIHFGHY